MPLRSAMVVDDDPRFRRALGRLLTEHQIQVTMADSCAKGVEALRSGLPDILFVDLQMPGARGDKLVRVLRQLRPRLPIVVCSGTADREDLVLLLHAGMSDFLQKPFGRKELDACLVRMTALADAKQEVPSIPQDPVDGPALPSGSEAPAEAATPEPPETMEALLRRVAEAEDTIPPMSPHLAEVQALMARPECGVDEVCGALENDPGVVSSLLRVARSPAFGSSRSPETVREACLVLGNRTALCIAHEAFASSLGVLSGPLADLSRATWRNATATAHAARLLAAEDAELDPDLAYLAGLFHNVGDAVLLGAAERLLRQGAELDAALVRQLSPSMHEALGAALARKWGLAPTIASISAAHHGPIDRLRDRKTSRYLDVVHTAHHLASAWVCAGLHPAEPPPVTDDELRRLEERMKETVVNLAA